MKYSVFIKFNKDFIEIDNNVIRVGIIAKPEKGKANKEVIEKIADYFKISRSRVKIISGLKSKIKIIEIT